MTLVKQGSPNGRLKQVSHLSANQLRGSISRDFELEAKFYEWKPLVSILAWVVAIANRNFYGTKIHTNLK